MNFCAHTGLVNTSVSGVLAIQFAPTWLLLRALLCRSPLKAQSAPFWLTGFSVLVLPCGAMSQQERQGGFS